MSEEISGERVEFEFWALTEGLTVKKDASQAYESRDTGMAREGWQAALAHKGETTLPTDGFVDIVFDAPPGPISGRFIEVEDDKGFSINLGEWVHRPDGYWALRIHSDPAPRSNDFVPGEPATPKATPVLADTGKIASKQAAPVPTGEAEVVAGLVAETVAIPVTPTPALLMPFRDCPPDELDLAWQAMVFIARKNQPQAVPSAGLSDAPELASVRIAELRDGMPGGSAHTPGPWSFQFEGDGGDYFIKSETTGEIIVSDSLSRDFKLDGPEHEHLKATVRLMAAAPELLAAVSKQHIVIDQLLAMLMEADPSFSPTKSVIWPLILEANAPAVVAKATGGTS